MSKNGTWGKLKQFFREVRAELKKVNWPNLNEIASYTLVVIVAVLVVALFIGGIDLVVSNLLRPIILN